MNDNKHAISEVEEVLKVLKQGLVQQNMYDTVCKHQDLFGRIGITSGMIKELLELEAQTAFCPDPTSYFIENQDRVDSIYENLDKPTLYSINENEIRFVSAIMQHDILLNWYRQDMKKISGLANEGLCKLKDENHEKLFGDREAEILTDLFLGKKIKEDDINSYSMVHSLFRKYDLHTAYNMDDNGVAIRWKAGLALESKGWLTAGRTEKNLVDEGFSIDKIQESIQHYEIDKLRVCDVKIVKQQNQPGKFISCQLDDAAMEMVRLSSEDAAQSYIMREPESLAIKYYKKVLDENRENNKAIADERTLARIDMPYTDRLVDIYRNGMSEQDIMLLKKAKNQDVDPFWIDTYLLRLDEEPVDLQKDAAFDMLVDHLDGLRPGMLSLGEFFSVFHQCPAILVPGREEENILMTLPECFLPLLEKSQEWEQRKGMLDYVKVMREIGKVTPQMAYNSMDYFLTNRLHTEWDPTGADDEYGQVTGCDFYPNKSMKNPAEKFPPNLLSEKQWTELGKMGKGAGASFVPHGAYKKDRVSDVWVYALRGDDMAIRCRVDGEQLFGRKLSEADALKCSSEADRKELATRYFLDAFSKDSVREPLLSR